MVEPQRPAAVEAPIATPERGPAPEPISADTPRNRKVWEHLGELQANDENGFSVKTRAGETLLDCELDGDLLAVRGKTAAGEVKTVTLDDVDLVQGGSERSASRMPAAPEPKAEAPNVPRTEPVAEPAGPVPAAREPGRDPGATRPAPVAEATAPEAKPVADAPKLATESDVGHSSFRLRSKTADRYQGAPNVIKEPGAAKAVGGLSDFHESPYGKFAVQELPGKGFRVIGANIESKKKLDQGKGKSLTWNPADDRIYQSHAEAADAAKAHMQASKGSENYFKPRDKQLDAQLRAAKATNIAGLGKGATAEEQTLQAAGNAALRAGEGQGVGIKLGAIAKQLAHVGARSEKNVEDVSAAITKARQTLAPMRGQHPELYRALGDMLGHVDGSEPMAPAQLAHAYRVLHAADPAGVPKTPEVNKLNAPIASEPLKLTETGGKAIEALASLKPDADPVEALGHFATLSAEMPPDHPLTTKLNSLHGLP